MMQRSSSRRLPPHVRSELGRLEASDVRTVRLNHRLGARPSELALLLGVEEPTIAAIVGLRRPGRRRRATGG